MIVRDLSYQLHRFPLGSQVKIERFHTVTMSSVEELSKILKDCAVKQPTLKIGGNFQKWKFALKFSLDEAGLSHYVDSVVTLPEKETEAKQIFAISLPFVEHPVLDPVHTLIEKKNYIEKAKLKFTREQLLVKRFLFQAVSEEFQECFVDNTVTVHALFQSIKKRALGNLTRARFMLLSKLRSLRVNNIASKVVEEYKRIVEEYEDLGTPMEDKSLKLLMLFPTTSYFQPTISFALSSIENENWDYKRVLDYVLTLVPDWDEHLKGASSKDAGKKKTFPTVKKGTEPVVNHVHTTSTAQDQSKITKSFSYSVFTDVTFLVDSGASVSLVNDLSLLQEVDDKVTSLTNISNEEFPASAVGRLELPYLGTMKAYFVPNAKHNVLSTVDLTTLGAIVSFEPEKTVISHKTWKVDIKMEKDLTFASVTVKRRPSTDFLLHYRLGHIGTASLRKVAQLANLKLSTSDLAQPKDCSNCLEVKQHKLASPHAKSLTHGDSFNCTRPLERLHLDTGDIGQVSINRFRYFVVIVDEYTKYTWTVLVAKKSKIALVITRLLDDIQKQFSQTIRALRTDNGSEFVNKFFQKYLDDQLISLETSSPYQPQQNGTAESHVKKLKTTAYTLLSHAKLPTSMWEYAFHTATFLLNRQFHYGINDIPFRKLFNKVPDYDRLRVFGAVGFYVNENKFPRNKSPCQFLGYSTSSKSYIVLCLDTKTIRAVHSLSLQETKLIEDNLEKVTKKKDEYWRSVMSVTKTFSFIPKSYHAIESRLKGTEQEQWKLHYQKEIQKLETIGQMKLVPRPKNTSVVKLREVFKLKEDPILQSVYPKVRITARGDLIDTQEEVYAHTATSKTLRLFLALHSHLFPGQSLQQTDITSAFPNASLGKTVHYELPVGHPQKNDGNDFVWKSDRALYGHKESPRRWNQLFLNVLKNMGFQIHPTDQSFVYLQKEDKIVLILVVYVDDILSSGTQKWKTWFVTELQKHFTVNTTTSVTKFLGLNITQKDTTVSITARDHIEQILNEHQSLPSSIPISVSNPEDPTKLLDRNEHSEFRSILGKVQYVSEFCRPDITFAVNSLSQFLVSPQAHHLREARRLLGYLRMTIDEGLHFKSSSSSNTELVLFTDAEFAKDKDRKSRYGFVTYFNGNFLSYKSKKLTLVTLSTTEAELLSFVHGLQDFLHVFHFLQHLGIPIQVRQTYCDNLPTIKILQDTSSIGRTKHIDLKILFNRQYLDLYDLALTHVKSLDNPADGFTKAMAFTAFKRWKSKLFKWNQENPMDSGGCGT